MQAIRRTRALVMVKAASRYDKKRANVSEDYARAVKSPGTGCCSSGQAGWCGCSPAPKGVAAKLAGYTNREIAALPAEAVANFFGCGDPNGIRTRVHGLKGHCPGPD
jgi:hypothetical protein